MALKSEISRDSGVQTDDDFTYDETPLLKHNKHVQYNGKGGYSSEHVQFSESKCDKVLLFLSTLTIEPVIFMFMFSYLVRMSCLTNLMLEKACTNQLNYSQEICSNLSSNGTAKEEVEKIGNVYGMYHQLIGMGLGAVATTFIGPWSDRYGRKSPLIIALLGITLCDVGVVLNTIYFEAPLGYLILASLPEGLSGGIIGFMSTLYSLASEVTSEKQRTMKYAFLELAMGLGISLGGLAGGMIYDYYDSLPVFVVATIGHIVCLPWIFFVTRETRGLDVGTTVAWTQKLRDLFSFKHLNEGFKAFSKPRPNHGRCQLWVLLGSISAIVLTYASVSSLGYVYAFHMYDWGPTKYSTVNSIFSTVGLFVGILCVPLFVRVFKVGDPILGFVGSLSMAAKNVLTAFATHTWIFYVAQSAGMLTSLAMLAVRSRMSKIAERDELGKVFTFLTTCESLVPVLGGIVMTFIYNSTVDTFPGSVYIVGAIALVFPIGAFVWIARLQSSPSVLPATDVKSGDQPSKV